MALFLLIAAATLPGVIALIDTYEDNRLSHILYRLNDIEHIYLIALAVLIFFSIVLASILWRKMYSINFRQIFTTLSDDIKNMIERIKSLDIVGFFSFLRVLWQYMKKWQIRLVILIATVVATSSGIGRLIETINQTSHDYEGQHVGLGLLEYVAAFATNGRFFIFTIVLSIIVAVSLIRTLLGKIMWSRDPDVTASGKIISVIVNRLKTWLNWLVLCCMIFIGIYLVQRQISTDDIVSFMSFVRGLASILATAILAILKLIVKYFEALTKSKDLIVDPPGGPTKPLDDEVKRSISTVAIRFIVAICILTSIIFWAVFVRTSDVIQQLINIIQNNLGQFEVLARPVVYIASFVVIVVMTGLAAAFITWLYIYAVSLIEKIVVFAKKRMEADKRSKLMIAVSAPITLLLSAIKGVTDIAKRLLISAVDIVMGPKTEGAQNRMVFVGAGIASLVSFFNSFIGLSDFFIPSNANTSEVVIRILIVIALCLAIQMSVLIFGLRAGSALIEMAHLCRLDVTAWWSRRENSGWWLAGVVVLWIPRTIFSVIHRFGKVAIIAVPYILFMIFSMFFAYTAMFTTYANSENANIRQLLYYEVMRETDVALGVREHIVEMEDEYLSNLNKLLAKFEDDVENLISERNAIHDIINTTYSNIRQSRIGARGTPLYDVYRSRSYEVGSDRRNLAMDFQDVEATAEVLRILMAMDYEAIGHVDMNVRRYGRHWSSIPAEGQPREINSRRSSSSIFMSFEIPGSTPNDKIVFSVGRAYSDGEPFVDALSSVTPLANASQNDNNTYFRTSERRVFARQYASHIRPNQDKYDLIRILFARYIEMRNDIVIRGVLIRDQESPDNITTSQLNNDLDNVADFMLEFHTLLDRNALIDSIRSQIAHVYRERNRNHEHDELHHAQFARTPTLFNGDIGQVSTTPYQINIRDLTRIAYSTLRSLVQRQPSDESPGFDALYNYVETSIDLFIALERLTPLSESQYSNDDIAQTTPMPIPLFTQINTHTLDSNASPIFHVRELRSYAHAITYSNFQMAADVLLLGRYNLNPSVERDDAGDIAGGLTSLYAASAVALAFLVFAFIKDFVTFAAGMLIRKDIYAFIPSDTAPLRRMGFVAYNKMLTKVFQPPKSGDLRSLYDEGLTAILKGALDKDASSELTKWHGEKMKQLQALGFEDNESDRACIALWLKSFSKSDKSITKLVETTTGDSTKLTETARGETLAS